MCQSCGDNSTGVIHRGVRGLTKAALALTVLPNMRAPEEVTRERRDQCRECEFATHNAKRADRPTKGLTSFSKCLKCGCFIAPKTLLASESCPLTVPKWGPVPPARR